MIALLLNTLGSQHERNKLPGGMYSGSLSEISIGRLLSAKRFRKQSFVFLFTPCNLSVMANYYIHGLSNRHIASLYPKQKQYSQ